MSSADLHRQSFIPKPRLFSSAASQDGEQESDHGGHQHTEQHADPHVAPLDLDLD